MAVALVTTPFLPAGLPVLLALAGVAAGLPYDAKPAPAAATEEKAAEEKPAEKQPNEQKASR